MSDRTPSSVRTGFPGGDAGAPAEPSAADAKPVSATQTIPGATTARAQGPVTGASAAVPPAGTPSGAPAVPPSTGSGPAVPAYTGATPVQGSSPAGVTSTGEMAGAGRGSRGRGTKSRGPRRARLQLRHIDTWSALKISLVLSIALFFIWMVAVGVLYGVLSALGVFDTLNDLFGQLGSASGTDSGGSDVVTPGVVFGGAAVIGAINIVLMTALCTVGTFIYNLCSDLVGGLELTLSERD
ncbi:DUF3566 domain-containing protein [Blastococcus sp. CT_GayMR16]|uniref:DUF3566 domain-containing protein n=1 Tax=Blastococcus sp. CT_GayMR16 TaxID=2559607 RepID=UPI0010739051|nr:DUF3566 domain-containing protein [Blastococcus sp. CT_GayMR16]TFV85705.1 DUF3566 domain-containing protein [Blastococcus sp. CT_GayMR16]